MADPEVTAGAERPRPKSTTPTGGRQTRSRVEFNVHGASNDDLAAQNSESGRTSRTISRKNSIDSAHSVRSFRSLKMTRQPSGLSTAFDTFVSVRSADYDFEHHHPYYHPHPYRPRSPFDPRRVSDGPLQHLDPDGVMQDEHTPLLQHPPSVVKEEDEGEDGAPEGHMKYYEEEIEIIEPTGTKTQCVLNMVKCALGSGVVSLPYAMSHAGIATSIFLLIFVAALNFWAVWMLLRCNQRLGDKARMATGSPYSAIGYQVMGRAGIALIEVFILLTVFGASVAYLIFIEDTMSAVAPAISRPAWVGISVIPLLGFVCLNNLSFLSYVSGIGLVGMVVGFAAVFTYGFSAHDFVIPADRMFLHIHGVANFFSTTVFTYGYPIVFFPLYQQMKKKSDADFLGVAVWSLVIVIVTLSLIGTLATGAFSMVPGGVQQNIFSNLPADSPAAILVRASMSLVMLMSYPPTFFALGQVIQNYALTHTNPGCARIMVNYGGRVILVLLSGVIAILIPKIGDVIAVLGSLTITMLSFTFPAFAYLRMWGPDVSRMERWGVQVFLVASVCVMIYTTCVSVHTMIKHMTIP